MKYTISGSKAGASTIVVSEGTDARVYVKGKDKNFKNVLDSVLGGTFEMEPALEITGAVFTDSSILDRDNVVDDFVDFLDLQATKALNLGHVSRPVCGSYTELAHQFITKHRLSGDDVATLMSFSSVSDINVTIPIYPHDLQKVVDTYWMDKRYSD